MVIKQTASCLIREGKAFIEDLYSVNLYFVYLILLNITLYILIKCVV